MTTKVKVADGKYTVVLNDDGTSAALRYDEAWPAYPNGVDNLTSALARDLQDARDLLREAGETLSTAASDYADNDNGGGYRAAADIAARIETALA